MTYKVKKLKSGYAIYHKGKRETMLIPDKKSADIVLKYFKEYESKQRGMKP